MEDKKIIFSGAQPTGKLSLANYIGAFMNWVNLQEEYNCYYCIVDLHSITVKQVPKDLRRGTLETLAQYIACGLDPKKNTIFIQSHVSAHAELSWVLNCLTYMGELNRMTQFKDKSKKNEDNINAGLFTYPALMASDILLYQTDLVPVGNDQKQHLELTRDIAQRFNNRYSPTFKIPEPYISKFGARIMSLQNPTSKMSKSDKDENATIRIIDSPDDIRRKIKRAVTDSKNRVKYCDEQPGIKNLITIYSKLTGEEIEDIEQRYESKGYGKFKNELAEVVVDALIPIRKEYERLMNNKDYLEEVYADGAYKAERKAWKTLRKVYKKVGFIKKKFKK